MKVRIIRQYDFTHYGYVITVQKWVEEVKRKDLIGGYPRLTVYESTVPAHWGEVRNFPEGVVPRLAEEAAGLFAAELSGAKTEVVVQGLFEDGVRL